MVQLLSARSVRRSGGAAPESAAAITAVTESSLHNIGQGQPCDGMEQAEIHPSAANELQMIIRFSDHFRKRSTV